MLLDVEPRMGDAATFGIAGQVTILNRQVIGDVHQCAPDEDFPDEASSRYAHLRIPAHIAQALGSRSGDQLPKRRRR